MGYTLWRSSLPKASDQLEALVKHDLEYQTAWAQWQELVQTLRLSNEGRPYPSRDEAHER